jgi:hypothetical protein
MILPPPPLPQHIQLSWDTIVSGDATTLQALLTAARPPAYLRALRGAFDLRFDLPADINPYFCHELRGLLRKQLTGVGIGFFLPKQSVALGVYALAQLGELELHQADASPMLGLRFRTEEFQNVSFRMAGEAYTFCLSSGMTPDEASRHCYELEVELAARFGCYD